ncbi:HAD-superfamily subfamily IB hydrolase, TIGR01490 [Streptomyces sp. 1222.5]|uniref:HAD family hydrolase n=1 Tax=unclassified Streptomyces TaxID=2593676 RepID=UPI000898222C|nr:MULTISPECIES: HAD-IB family hydrolase [unclassified Streptomyces]PKW05242.1 HAD superfamily hydrolase (TIGR01490 family) [Streptomyces sp. 5112.2]SED46095.1 HAD-superfamily subfamily IB hydrolase, TIGR01490 [Streptomyces sp. 1222.5]
MTTATGTGCPTLAFFDVDETLIAEKSMIEFWRHWSRLHPTRVATDWLELRTEATVTPDRETLNRGYYRRYAGVALADLEAAGRTWYDGYRRGGTAFVRSALRAVAAHRAAGREVVLVSGSMRPLLAPLADELAVATVVCTELVVGPGGVLTGEVHRPMIGAAKGEAVVRVMRERGADPQDCFAYGDHESDLAMLRAVGNPVVVGDSPLLNDEAERFGWSVASARRGPFRSEST